MTIAFGTDMGVGPHGENAREFGYMVEAGMPFREAIEAATVNAAKLLDLSELRGTIEKNGLSSITWETAHFPAHKFVHKLSFL